MIRKLRRFAEGLGVSKPEYPALDGGRIVYAIGDIHGRSDLLDRVHAAIDRDGDAAADITEVYLGDYVDRGPDSFGVLERLIARRSERNVVCLKGNHEEMVLQFLYGKLSVESWRRSGGLETLQSYGISAMPLAHAPSEVWLEVLMRRLPLSHFEFLTGLACSHRVGGYFFAHAGVRPGVSLDEQTPNDLMWIRDGFLGDRSDFGAVVVHGHTPTPKVEFLPNRINIDTGAYATDQLTCLRIDESGPRILV